MDKEREIERRERERRKQETKEEEFDLRFKNLKSNQE